MERDPEVNPRPVGVPGGAAARAHAACRIPRIPTMSPAPRMETLTEGEQLGQWSSALGEWGWGGPASGEQPRSVAQREARSGGGAQGSSGEGGEAGARGLRPGRVLEQSRRRAQAEAGFGPGAGCSGHGPAQGLALDTFSQRPPPRRVAGAFAPSGEWAGGRAGGGTRPGGRRSLWAAVLRSARRAAIPFAALWHGLRAGLRRTRRLRGSGPPSLRAKRGQAGIPQHGARPVTPGNAPEFHPRAEGRGRATHDTVDPAEGAVTQPTPDEDRCGLTWGTSHRVQCPA